MRQLSSLDAQFLALESDRNYGHVGSVAILDPSTAPGGRVTIEDVRRLLGERLHLIPPFTRRLAEVPLGLALPYWVPDDHFDLGYHCREIALPPPGSTGAAGRAGGPHLLAAPRSLAPPVGAVPDPRTSRRPGGAAHEDPPRGRGRHVRRRDPHASLRPLARPAARGAAGRPAGAGGRPPGTAGMLARGVLALPALPGHGRRARGPASAARRRARLAARRARHAHGQPGALAGAEAREPGPGGRG